MGEWTECINWNEYWGFGLVGLGNKMSAGQSGGVFLLGIGVGI